MARHRPKITFLPRLKLRLHLQYSHEAQPYEAIFALHGGMER